jgi:acetyl-CoA C-acetyltransferase
VLVADYAGLTGVEAFTVEAGDASGGGALRAGYLAVASGAADVVIVSGVEKSSDTVGAAHVEARNVALDADYEAAHGATLTGMAALLMRRYMHEHGVELDCFEGFSANAHANGRNNSYAMFRNSLRPGMYLNAPMVSDPVNLFDGAPDGDGAAALLLCSEEVAGQLKVPAVRIAGSAVATDTMLLQDRHDLLYFSSVANSTEKALKQAGIGLADIDLYELHDAYTIMSTLSIEAMRITERGKGWQLSTGEHPNISLRGSYPMSTFGGLKSRGNPAGATGIYQAVEAVLQLRGQAGDNQVQDAKYALIQNLGGVASTAVTHVLEAI